jgi:2-hydroxycyclohexanecarboxyl-CoA dehydrogenase
LRSPANAPSVAVVSGGGSGIGAATCRQLAERGHQVAVLDLDGAGATRVAKEIEGSGGTALAFEVDVTDRPAVDAAFRQIRADLGPTQILVTSAGQCVFTSFLDIHPEEWDRVFAVNVTGTFHCCQAALPDMLDGGWGRIVMISSSSGQRGSPKAPHYAAAKGAVIALTKSLALTYADKGITVNNIPPSGIETPMQHAGQLAGHLPSNEDMARSVPVGYLGSPDDIAAMAVFLTSEEARFITGQTIGVNGGQVL